jgi:hypothetical protein
MWKATVVARNVFVLSDTEIVGSNPTRGLDVCVCSVFLLPCVGSGLATGVIPRDKNPVNCV